MKLTIRNMKILKYIKAWSTVSLLLALTLGASAILSSCEKEEVMDDVILQSFGPSGVKHGDKIKFIGINLDKVTAVILQPNVEVKQFETKSASLLEIIVPKEAEAGKITLKTPKGDVVSKSVLSFEVPVTITSITAEARPGSEITITGDLLNWVETITFEDGLEVNKEEFVSQSIDELVVTVPDAAQTGYLIFKTGGTEPLTFASENKLQVTLPVVTALTPADVRHTADLTITGTDLDLVTSITFGGGAEVLKANFKSQTATEIVVAVPATAEKGKLTLKQLPPVDVVTSQVLTIVLPVGTSITPTPSTPGQDDITISGTDLDLVKELILPGSGSISTFISQSATEIVLALPAEASFGPVNYVTIHDYAGSLGVVIILPSEGPPPLLVPVYDDAVNPDIGTGGGWGGAVTTFGSTANFREGANSIKVDFAGDWGGAAQFGTWGKPDLSISGTEVFTFSIYGGAGTGGKVINVNIKFDTDNVKEIPIVEGEWTDVEIPLSELGNITAIREIWFQDRGWAGTVYIDRIGFSMASGPEKLSIIAYDDAIASTFGQGGWGGATIDYANTESTREGSNAIKINYAGDWSGAPQLGTWGKDNLSIAGMTVFAFSIYGTPGTGGKELNVNVKFDSDNPQIITIEEGKWVDVEIPLSNFGSFTEVTEIWFQDRGWTGTVYVDYMGFK